jgi:hypothetical protein
VDVGADQRVLTVGFLEPVVVAQLEPARYALSGGRRLHPRVTSVTGAVGALELDLHLDQPGDFSIYTLTVRGDDIDPFFATKRFSFKIACENPFDCRPPEPPPAETPPSPEIDYLTKDYAGFRQLLLDQIPARLPQWTERSEADLGIALIELFSEAADRLSYYQDRVANEAYLGTATQRRSVQLHTALIAYQLRPGVAAATYLQFQARVEALIPVGAQVRTAAQGDETAVLFETGPGDFLVRPEHNALTPFTWGNARCCLERGANEITLLGDYSTLAPGDAILIADADIAERREIVTLTAAPVVLPPDPVKGDPVQRLTVLQWSAAQALHRDYCLDAGQTVVRGNLVPATHGASVSEHIGDGDEAPRRLRLALGQAPLTYLGSASSGAVTSLQIAVDGEPWEEHASLIESGRFDQHYRVELDEDGAATVVFGDGVRGRKPATGVPIDAKYRVGIGPAGNVGRDALVVLVTPIPEISGVTNPLAATGGRAPEDLDHAKRVAPLRIRTPIRCVTEADYERAATEYREDGVPRIQRARARFRWTGSWLTVFVCVDPIGGDDLSDATRAGLRAFLEDRKLAGYDLDIAPTRYVPLLIGLQVCLKRDRFAAAVAVDLRAALSNGVNADGTSGFFHPDRFTFGDPVLLSRLYAAIEAVPGVDSVAVTDLRRLRERDPDTATQTNIDRGFLPIAEMEIARLDNDPSFPENGRLELQLVGGRGT